MLCPKESESGAVMKETYKWIYRKKEEEALLPFFREEGIPVGAARIMQRRGVRTKEALHHFLYDTLDDLADPFLMKGMKETVERLLLARDTKEKVVIYGDYDVDGITSTSILYRFFHRIGMDTGFYIPGREGEGYGLNEGAVEKLKKEGYTLLITVDCGISSAALIDQMADVMDFIVTDHHLPPDVLPRRAVAIVNPHQKDCPYPYEDLAGCGVAFTVCRAISKVLYNENYKEDVELAALGTVADMVSLTGENRVLVREGLARFRSTKIKGLAALLRAAGVVNDDKPAKPVTSEQVSFGLAPRINASGRIRHAREGVALMITEEDGEARRLSERLCALNLERQTTERGIYEEALKRLHTVHKEGDMALVVDGDNWHPGVIGIVASRILELMHRPALVITKRDGVGKGSCRSIPGFNIYEALKAQSDLLLQFGGHTMAAGFSIKEENIPLFRERLNAYAETKITPEDCIPQMEIEEDVPLPEVTLDFIHSLSLLEPCGCDNPKPLFSSRGVFVESSRRMGAENRHFKCLLSQDGVSVESVFWNPGETDPCTPGDEVAVAYEPEIHDWYGEHVQLIGRDVQEMVPDEETKLDRDFLVQVFLKIRALLERGSLATGELQSELSRHFGDACPPVKMKAGLVILGELGILSRYNRNGQEYFMYHALKSKMDLHASPTYQKYSKEGGL